MTPGDIKEVIFDILEGIAPDEDLSHIVDDVPLREQLELDSMDFLDIVMELRKRYRVQIPEDDYVELATMQSTVELPLAADEGFTKGLTRRPWTARSARRDRHPSRPVRFDSLAAQRGLDCCRGRSAQLAMSKYDTIIIGAGMSGLAAGIRLAHFDRPVCILERHTAIGGLNSYYRLDGRNYDVGLHAVTNYTPKGTRKGPLARLLRQLRIRWDDFGLVPQLGSRIAFPGVSLGFSNDFEFFRSEVERHFPREKDGFQRLTEAIVEYDDLDERSAALSARGIVGQFIKDRLLIEMLFCPLMFYGAAREHDMDFGQFSVMFRSIFMEGLPGRGRRCARSSSNWCASSRHWVANCDYAPE